MADQKNPNLQNKVVFTQRRFILGIPDRVFLGALLLVGFIAFVFISYMGAYLGGAVSVLMALLILIPVYLVHRDDPDAYLVWLRGFITPVRLTVSRIIRRRIVLLAWDQNGPSVTTTLRGIQK